jgi:hypothetical protein
MPLRHSDRADSVLVIASMDEILIMMQIYFLKLYVICLSNNTLKNKNAGFRICRIYALMK